MPSHTTDSLHWHTVLWRLLLLLIGGFVIALLWHEMRPRQPQEPWLRTADRHYLTTLRHLRADGRTETLLCKVTRLNQHIEFAATPFIESAPLEESRRIIRLDEKSRLRIDQTGSTTPADECVLHLIQYCERDPALPPCEVLH